MVTSLNGTDYNEQWGTLRENERIVTIIDHVLAKALRDDSFSFDAVKKEWADNGWIGKYQNRYKKKSSVQGVKTYCIDIVMPRNSD